MALSDHLNTSLGYAFTRAYVAQSFNILDYPPYSLVPSLGGTGALASLFSSPIPEGRNLPGVSRHVFNAAVDYSMSEAFGLLRFHVDGAYRSGQASTISPSSIYNFSIPSAVLVNARISLEPSPKLNFAFFVRNITNNPDISGGIDDQLFDNPYRLRNVGRPRTVGIGIRYSF